MAKLPDELLISEKDLARFSTQALEDVAAGLEFRAKLLHNEEEFIKAQPEPDKVRLEQLDADVKQTEDAAKSAHALAANIGKGTPRAEPGDRVISVHVRDANGAPVAGQIKIVEQGHKGLTLTGTSTDTA